MGYWSSGWSTRSVRSAGYDALTMIEIAHRRIDLAEVPDVHLGVMRRSVKELIGDKLVSLIASGVLQVGDELPSEREFASIFSVSRETVRGAIQTLAAKGILQVSHGAR